MRREREKKKRAAPTSNGAAVECSEDADGREDDELNDGEGEAVVPPAAVIPHSATIPYSAAIVLCGALATARALACAAGARRSVHRLPLGQSVGVQRGHPLRCANHRRRPLPGAAALAAAFIGSGEAGASASGVAVLCCALATARRWPPRSLACCAC
ncbi:hypothetical protein OsJ_14214 [Oryza sativa Japonica Group]|uniref:Uncharacterized protein n=1 Tax=Oryza sativa subsp. japonica TaxID=39947 RepID=A3AS69_ORYSJ|nr:hypothetical protein OsJ_14214 [Oryza sativa Japonica Group]